MVRFKSLVPAEESLNSLRLIRPPLQICERQSSDKKFRPRTLFLRSADQKDLVQLNVEYGDVQFKFEIFSLAFRVAPTAAAPELQEVARFKGWNALRCMFVFEWQRPATEADLVPPAWVQVVHGRGTRSEIPETATALGVSLIGIDFCDSNQRHPVGLIYTDESDPTALFISQDAQEISNLEEACEIIRIEEFPQWKRNLERWRKSFAARLRARETNLVK